MNFNDNNPMMNDEGADMALAQQKGTARTVGRTASPRAARGSSRRRSRLAVVAPGTGIVTRRGTARADPRHSEGHKSERS